MPTLSQRRYASTRLVACVATNVVNSLGTCGEHREEEGERTMVVVWRGAISESREVQPARQSVGRSNNGRQAGIPLAEPNFQAEHNFTTWFVTLSMC